MKALAVALGRSSLKRAAELCSASFSVAESSSLVLFDPEVSTDSVGLEVPCPFENVWLLKREGPFSPEQLKGAIREIGEIFGASAFIFNDSSLSFWVSSLLAGELKIPIVTDAVRLKRESERIVITKPMMNESVWADFSVSMEGFVAVIRKGFPIKKMETSVPTMKIIDVGSYPKKLKILEERTADSTRLEDATIVVGLGDGVRQSGTLNQALELSKLLNAEYACTKPLVESGIVGAERLIGISGKRISPKIYIALGISGSAYHVAGVSSSDTIISVNLDRGCPMNRLSDYYYVGDLKEVLPRLIQLLKSGS
ncbi:MAG: electron transfer flavoprotein subunit alpha/FixB family protein [Fervidicoccaceae archaeon]